MTEPTLEMPIIADTLPSVAGYRLEALAGSGGMARVYRAVEEGLDRPVAIKVLCAHGGDAVSHQARFEREARLVATLQHPNIVSIYRVTRTRAGDPCIVMPWLNGSLADRALPMPEAQARELLGNLLSALGHAHAAHIVHRDLKPDNVLFDSSGRPLLADFGVALQVGGDARLTGEGLAVGSARYMSPEQALGRAVDARSDLYSLGVLAYEVLTGAPPFVARDAIAAALAHVEAPVPPLPYALTHWQSWFDRVLAKAPQDRFSDAEQMSAEMPQVASEASASANAPAQAFNSSQRWLLFATLLALVAVVWWWWLSPAEPGNAAPAASSAVSTATTEPLPVAAVAETEPDVLQPSPGALYERFRDLDGPWMVNLPTSSGRSRAVSQTEITRAQYAEFVQASGRRDTRCNDAGRSWREPGFAQGDDHPVVCVSFADARAYAAWLTGRSGKRYRLPTLADFEQLSAPLREQALSCEQARLSAPGCEQGDGATATVGVETQLASMPGLFGIVGNVREWTRDCSWKVEKANPVTHGLRGVGRWIQRKESLPRETRTCIGRKITGSGFADTQPWPPLQIHAESSAFPDVGFRLVREN